MEIEMSCPAVYTRRVAHTPYMGDAPFSSEACILHANRMLQGDVNGLLGDTEEMGF